ncbi:hypothetical protein E3N88_37532 [Mikania micrantha]|uniref:GRF-type domain-containing protein n=1 Tax=Mikania micrantha TaxID=192012 RepID=A0A5N6LSD5_9ASTR|nr:hypothetical protein E3N88_37532 [Mikania micrantha]
MSSFSSNQVGILCQCGAATRIRTSWTQANPRRRFYCCVGTCGFVRWADPPATDRAGLLIEGLVHSLKKERCVSSQRARENKRLKWLLIGSWGVFIWRYFDRA